MRTTPFESVTFTDEDIITSFGFRPLNETLLFSIGILLVSRTNTITVVCVLPSAIKVFGSAIIYDKAGSIASSTFNSEVSVIDGAIAVNKWLPKIVDAMVKVASPKKFVFVELGVMLSLISLLVNVTYAFVIGFKY